MPFHNSNIVGCKHRIVGSFGVEQTSAASRVTAESEFEPFAGIFMLHAPLRPGSNKFERPIPGPVAYFVAIERLSHLDKLAVYNAKCVIVELCCKCLIGSV